MAGTTEVLFKILFLFAFLSTSTAFKDFVEMDPTEYRLPNDTIPLNYTLRIVADPKSIRFSGHASIRIKTLSQTSRIVLHSKNLDLGRTTLRDIAGNMIQILNVDHILDDRDFLIINLREELVVGGLYDLEFEYSAPFAKDSKGFYASSYFDGNGTVGYFAATQAKPTHARQIYPCFDEPSFKATFKIHIYGPKGYAALSNMDAIESDQPTIEGYDVTSFGNTPLMSTYSVAFIISDFEYKSNTEGGEIVYPKEYRVYARRGALRGLDYPLDFGQRSLQCLEDYLDFDYRLPKIDNVALAVSEDVGGNWGIITHREDDFAVDESGGIEFKMRVSILLSRANAYFWFGDEVTPIWWDWVWLSEGFATFFGFYATDEVFSGNWRVMEQFTVNEIHDVMIPDALPSANPMTNVVGSPDEIQLNLDAPGAVIRMMQNVLGESIFRLSLIAYLKSLPLGVSNSKILFDEMQKVVGQTNVLPTDTSVEDVFKLWTTQSGYPILYAERIGESYVQLSQRRFYMNSSLSSDEKWWIPLTWTTQENPEFQNTTTQLWLIPILTQLSFPLGRPEDWFMFNKQQSGYYRVMYDIENWKKLANALRGESRTIIHPLNKAQLIDDASIFAQTGRLTYNVTFDLLNYLDEETDWIPWITADKTITFLNARMPVSDQYFLYKTFLVSKSKTAYESVGLSANETDGYPIRRMRSLVGKISCEAGFDTCLKDAEDILDGSLDNNVAVDPDVELIVYCYGVRSGDESLWWRLFDEYVNDEKQSEYIISGLACSNDAVVIDRYLNMTIDDSSLVRKQDREIVVRSIVKNGQLGIERVLRFLIDNYLIIRNNTTGVGSTINILQDLGSVIVTMQQIELFQNFTEIYQNDFTPLENKEVEQAWLKINENQIWRREFIDTIEIWLTENVSIRF